MAIPPHGSDAERHWLFAIDMAKLLTSIRDTELGTFSHHQSLLDSNLATLSSKINDTRMQTTLLTATSHKRLYLRTVMSKKGGGSEFRAWQLSMSTATCTASCLSHHSHQMTSRTSHKAGLLQWNEFSTISLLHNWVCLEGIFATHRRPSQGPYNPMAQWAATISYVLPCVQILPALPRLPRHPRRAGNSCRWQSPQEAARTPQHTYHSSAPAITCAVRRGNV